jgi:hypothetical protein
VTPLVSSEPASAGSLETIGGYRPEWTVEDTVTAAVPGALAVTVAW